MRDFPAPLGRKTPLAFRDYKWLAGGNPENPKIQARRQQYGPIIAEAVNRAMYGEDLHLCVFWREPDTHEFVEEQLRNAFLLNDGEPFPPHVNVSFHFIEDATLLEPLEVDGFKPGDRSAFDQQIQQQWGQKKQAWHQYLKSKLPPHKTNCFVIVEIGRRKQKGIYPQQSIYGAVREACALAGVSSQMVQTVTTAEKGPYKIAATRARILNAALDVTHRHIGVIYGLPADLYRTAHLREDVAQDMDVIAFCRRRTTRAQKDIHYALAIKLCRDGVVEVLLPDAQTWILYARAGSVLGQLFSEARSDHFESGKRLGQRDASGRLHSRIKLNSNQLAQFIARVLTQNLHRPTLALIEADGWRNERAADEEGKVWPQLKNEYLWHKRDVLDFSHLSDHHYPYRREEPDLNQLLAVIRLRRGKETPQYVTNRVAWNDNLPARDFTHLSGFWDALIPELPHYFSVGRLPDTQRSQDDSNGLGLYKLDEKIKGGKPQYDEYGANTAYKHPQMVEMVPFFVRDDFQTEEGKLALCRAAHYLRSSPAWSMGNLVLPYPMHLGDMLIDDQLCILGIED